MTVDELFNEHEQSPADTATLDAATYKEYVVSFPESNMISHELISSLYASIVEGSKSGSKLHWVQKSYKKVPVTYTVKKRIDLLRSMSVLPSLSFKQKKLIDGIYIDGAAHFTQNFGLGSGGQQVMNMIDEYTYVDS